MKLTIDVPPCVFHRLRKHGIYSLCSPPGEGRRAASYQAAQILIAGVEALDRAGADRPRDIEFNLSQKRLDVSVGSEGTDTVMIELPSDLGALAHGVAGYHGKTVHEWASECVARSLSSDLTAAAEDVA